MNLKKLGLWVAALMALAMLSGCAGELTPYQRNDAENFTVSVKYDANGGTFTTNTSVIVDSYCLAQLPVSGGQAQVALLPPDDPARGNDAFSAVNNGYFLAGWYAQRTEADGGFVYAQPWDFAADTLALDPAGAYTSAEPVLTLYAAWVPMFSVEFIDRATGENLGSYSFDPRQSFDLGIPAWDETTGRIEMHRFPTRSGMTFAAAWLDPAGTVAVTGEALAHPGTVDAATGTAQNGTMQVYVDYQAGEWYHIYNVEQFLDNASVAGSYVLHADLDFQDEIWPTSLMYGNFSGTIQGNGHTMKNITVTQTNNSKVNAGLFGQLSEGAVLEDVTFENVTFTVKSGTRVAGASYGVLCGTLSDSAVLENVAVSGVLQVDSGCYFGSDDYVIGLVCGMGNADAVQWQIGCAAVGDAPESLTVTAEGNAVSVEFVG